MFDVGCYLFLGYAGRLDPMARGVLVLLVDDENKNRTQYEFFDKEYTFKCIFGLSTDTYDVLGLIQEKAGELSICSSSLSPEQFQQELQNHFTTHFLGKHFQLYPPYSSVRVKGKPLFQWAKEGKLDQVTIPGKNVEIHSIVCDLASK